MAVASTTVVTQAEFRTFLNIPSDETGMNDMIDAILDGLNDAIEDHIGVALINTDYDEYYDGEGKQELWLKHYPVNSITSITDDGDTIASSEYHLYSDMGLIQLDDSDSGFTDDYKSVHVQYSAGHGTDRDSIPRPIKLALKIWASLVYKGMTYESQRSGEGQIQNVGQATMPSAVRALLEPYRIRKNRGV